MNGLKLLLFITVLISYAAFGQKIKTNLKRKLDTDITRDSTLV